MFEIYSLKHFAYDGSNVFTKSRIQFSTADDVLEFLDEGQLVEVLKAFFLADPFFCLRQGSGAQFDDL